MTVWNIDTAHTSAEFSARHMMITTVRGSITNITGAVVFDPANPASASVEATLDATTLVTGMADRDNHLKSPDFLDVANYPTIAFRSTQVAPSADGQKARVTGDLTIRGVTRPVTMDVEFLGMGNSPFGDTRAGFTASTKINREDWGLTWNMALEAGGVLVGKEIGITLDVEVIKVTEAALT